MKDFGTEGFWMEDIWKWAFGKGLFLEVRLNSNRKIQVVTYKVLIPDDV